MLQSKGSNGLKILVVELARDLKDTETIAPALAKAWEKSSQQGLNDLEINGGPGMNVFWDSKGHSRPFFIYAIGKIFVKYY